MHAINSACMRLNSSSSSLRDADRSFAALFRSSLSDEDWIEQLRKSSSEFSASSFLLSLYDLYSPLIGSDKRCEECLISISDNFPFLLLFRAILPSEFCLSNAFLGSLLACDENGFALL